MHCKVSCLVKWLLLLVVHCMSMPIMHFQTLVQSTGSMPIKIYPVHLRKDSLLDAKLAYEYRSQNLSMGLYQKSNSSITQKYKQIKKSDFVNLGKNRLSFTSQVLQIYYIFVYPVVTPIQDESIKFNLTYKVDNEPFVFSDQFVVGYLTLTPRSHVTTLTIICAPPPGIKVLFQILYKNSSVVKVGEFESTVLQHEYGVYDGLEYVFEGDESVGVGVSYLKGWVEGYEDNGIGIYLRVDGLEYLASHQINKFLSYFLLFGLVIGLLGCGFYFSNKIYMKSHVVEPLDFVGDGGGVPVVLSNVQISSIIPVIKAKQKEYDQFNQQIQNQG